MSENNAQAFLRRALVIGPNDRLERVENILVPGMPDVNGCISAAEFWIENKEPTEPKRASTPLFGSNHRFSQEQLNWFLKQQNAGGHAFGFVWTDKRGMLLGPALVQLANDATLECLLENCLWHCTKPVSKVMRDHLRTTILNRCRR